MSGIGFTEMLLIAGIALIVMGPEKFPDFAKLVIRTIRDLRGYVDDIKQEVTKELKPLKKEMDTLSRIDPEKYIDSLTKETETPKTSAPAVHQEDQKILDEADMYGEDPYGWQGEEPGGYDKDPGGGAPPADTVSYGQEEAAADGSANGTGDEAAPAEAQEGPAEDAMSPDPDAVEIEAMDRMKTEDESDVWTNRS